MPKVVVFGYLSIDRIIAPGVDVGGTPGGGALYAALGARMAGADAVIVACGGEDFPADWVAAIADLGVETSWIAWRSGPTRRARLSHAADGARRSSHYDDDLWRRRTAELAPPATGPRADIAVLCPMPLDRASTILDELTCPAVADTSEAFAADSAAWRRLVSRLRLFAPSREETALLRPGVSDDDAIVALAALHCDIVQKRGKAGLAYCRAGSAAIATVAPPKVRAIDPTGAGDATVGALAARLAAGDDLAAACCAAVQIGAATTTGAGASALGLDATRDAPLVAT